jgi:hypothetical protein
MTTTTPTVSPPSDKNAATWSPLRRHTPPLPSTSPPSPVSPSLHHNDIGFTVSSSSPPLTTVPANDLNDQPVESPSCTPSPPPSLSSLPPETLLMDTSNEIQSTPHSPDPIWRADSPSGGSDIPIHILNHNGPSESQLEVLVKGLEEVQQGAPTEEDGRWESPVVDGGDQMGLEVSSSCSPSPPSPVSRVFQGDANIIAVDGRDGDQEENATTDYMNVGRLNDGSPARLESAPPNDVGSCEPSSSFFPPQPLPLESLSLWTHQQCECKTSAGGEGGRITRGIIRGTKTAFVSSCPQS